MNAILYTEDEPDDVFFMERAFKGAGIPHPLHTVGSADQAIAYLDGTGIYADRERHPFPVLLLLDLNLPGVSGFEVLKWIRNQPGICALPVIVLTSSNQESDLRRASLLGANGYLVKPGRPDRLVEMVKALQEYWLRHDRFSRSPEAAKVSGASESA